MNKATAILSAATVVIAAALSTAAEAKDWIEKVDIVKGGVDVVPVEVRANANGYTGMKTKDHAFGLRLYAKATSGERIVAGVVGAYNGVEYFEAADPNRWEQKLRGREIGGGQARTFSRSYDVSIPLAKVTWKGNKDPVKACAAKLASEVQKGRSKANVLKDTLSTDADVFLQFQAVAAHKGKANSGNWGIGSTTTERKSMSYRVTVRCLPAS